MLLIHNSANHFTISNLHHLNIRLRKKNISRLTYEKPLCCPALLNLKSIILIDNATTTIQSLDNPFAVVYFNTLSLGDFAQLTNTDHKPLSVVNLIF